MTNKRHVVQDSSDPGEVNKALDQEKDRDADLGFVLSKPRGRRFLHTLLRDVCHVNRRSHVPGSPEDTAFNEGARSIGLELERRMREGFGEQWLQLLRENELD